MNVLTLTKLELNNYLGINELRNSKDPAIRKNRGLMLGVIIFLMIVLAGYVAGQAVGMSMIGLTQYIPLLYFIAAFVANLCMGIYKAKATIYREKDLDQMSVFPVSGVSIVASRIFRMYVDNFLLTLGIIVPAMILYGIKSGSGVGVYISILPMCIILPILPSAIAAWVGIIFAAIIARNRHKVLTEVLLALVIVIGSFVISGVISAKAGVGTPGASTHKNEINAEITAELTRVATEKMESITRSFPILSVLGNVLGNADFVGLLVYAIISVVVFALTVFIIGKNFFSISAKLFNTQIHREYKLEGMQKQSIIMALVKKEAARYFSSGIYVSNTIMGFVMAVIFSVTLGFVDIETMISSAGELPIELNFDASIGFIVALLLGMMSISASSVSMEGKNWWIVRTLPLSSKEILGAKLLFNLIVAAPFYALTEIIMLFTVNAGILERLRLIMIPAVSTLYSILLGLVLNLKFPKFNWEKEMDVVKQSAATGLSLLGGIVIVIFTMGVMLVPMEYENIYNLIYIVIMGLICGMLYKKIIETKLEKLV